MVPDVLYELAETFVDFMNRMTLVDAALCFATGTFALPFAVFIHEVGHAVAAVALRRRVTELTVGDASPLLTLRAGSFRLRLGSVTGEGDAAGFILYEDDLASPRHTFVIALAGPVASLAGAVATGVMTAGAWGTPGLSLFFGIATLVGLTAGVSSLRVSGESPSTWSDGVWVRGAWRAMRRPTPNVVGARDPREATSIPPPLHDARTTPVSAAAAE